MFVLFCTYIVFHLHHFRSRNTEPHNFQEKIRHKRASDATPNGVVHVVRSITTPFGDVCEPRTIVKYYGR